MTTRTSIAKSLRTNGLQLIDTLPRYVYNFRDEVYKNKVINDMKRSTCPDINEDYVIDKFNDKYVKTPGIRTFFVLDEKTHEIAAYVFYKFSRSICSSRLHNSTSSNLGRHPTTKCTVELLCTNEKYRNMGLGKMLIELIKLKTIAVKKTQKTTLCIVELETLNKGLCKYYNRFGFIEESANRFYMKTKDLV